MQPVVYTAELDDRVFAASTQQEALGLNIGGGGSGSGAPADTNMWRFDALEPLLSNNSPIYRISDVNIAKTMLLSMLPHTARPQVMFSAYTLANTEIVRVPVWAHKLIELNTPTPMSDLTQSYVECSKLLAAYVNAQDESTQSLLLRSAIAVVFGRRSSATNSPDDVKAATLSLLLITVQHTPLLDGIDQAAGSLRQDGVRGARSANAPESGWLANLLCGFAWD